MEAIENLFGFQQIEASTESNSTLIFEEVRKEVKEYLLEENHDTDSTDGVFNFLSPLFLNSGGTSRTTETVIRNVFLGYWQEYLPYKHIRENKKNTYNCN